MASRTTPTARPAIDVTRGRSTDGWLAAFAHECTSFIGHKRAQSRAEPIRTVRSLESRYPRGTGSTRRPRGGSHVTSVLSLLAFIAVANAVGGGMRVLYAGHFQMHSLRLVINVAVSAVLSTWVLARVRAQWGQEARMPAPVVREEADRESSDARRSPTRSSGWMRRGRWVLIAGLVAVAGVTIASEWGTLQTAFGELRHLHWHRLRWAIYAEALAMIAFAQLTRLLLRAGGVHLGLGSMTGLTLASNAVALTLPGGQAWAVTFSFDQLRRRGVRRALTAYAVTVTWVMSAAALVIISLVGIDLAGSSGPAAPFRVTATVCAVGFGLALLAGALVVRIPRFRAATARVVDRLCESSQCARIAHMVRTYGQELGEVRLPAPLLLRCVAAALLNWIYDCGCLVFSILAVGGHVPWQGVLAAYGLTQLAGALPITPGGIGVIEGTLSVLLIAYHMPGATAIAAVMLYRIISFWILVPVGWGSVAALLAMQRGSRARAAWISRLGPTRRRARSISVSAIPGSAPNGSSIR